MLSLLRGLDRVLLGSEMFSCIGFEVYIQWGILFTYKDVLYVPEDAGAVPVLYADIVNRFDELDSAIRTRTEEKYKLAAKEFDTWENGGQYEGEFARRIVGYMYNEWLTFNQQKCASGIVQ